MIMTSMVTLSSWIIVSITNAPQWPTQHRESPKSTRVTRAVWFIWSMAIKFNWEILEITDRWCWNHQKASSVWLKLISFQQFQQTLKVAKLNRCKMRNEREIMIRRNKLCGIFSNVIIIITLNLSSCWTRALANTFFIYFILFLFFFCCCLSENLNLRVRTRKFKWP